MITLKTLPQATAQEVFDQVVNHLRTQGKPARKSSGGLNGCYYRVGELKCAAGCLIADNEYKPIFEQPDKGYGSAWPSLVSRGEVPEIHSDLIYDLQQVHDNSDVPAWETNLKDVAKRYNLEYKQSA